MENQIGQTFQHGNRTYEVCHAKEYKSCKGCAFCEPDGNRCTLNRVENDVPECIGLHRADGLNVVFVEVVNEKIIEEIAKENALQLFPDDRFRIMELRDAYVKGFIQGVRIRIENDKEKAQY